MIPGIRINLSGTEYTVPPLSLGAIEVLQDRLVSFKGTLADASTVIDALTDSLQRNYPDVTREKVAKIVGLENYEEVFEAVMDVSGLRRKAIEAAKAAAAATPEAQGQGEA